MLLHDLPLTLVLLAGTFVNMTTPILLGFDKQWITLALF
jgi:hypothetical protein